jgi:hypothetical protein
MKELLRTNNAVFLSWVTALLRSEGVDAVVLDTHAAAVEGSISAIQRRVMVADDDHERARRIVQDAGEGERLR